MVKSERELMKDAVCARGRKTRSTARLAAGFGRIIGALCIALHAAGAGAADTAVSPADLSTLTIEELANIDISSVSKRPEPLAEAAASVYVITSEQIRR
ncbi:MAG: hypothetical protein ACREBD_38175, partial [Blastocatellia bacterium]